MADTRLCSNCSRLKIQLLPIGGRDAPGFNISTLEDLYLNQQCQRCPLCRIFRTAAELRDRITDGKDQFLQKGNLDVSKSYIPIVLTRYEGDPRPSPGGLKMSGFDVRVEGSIACSERIKLYSPEGRHF